MPNTRLDYSLVKLTFIFLPNVYILKFLTFWSSQNLLNDLNLCNYYSSEQTKRKSIIFFIFCLKKQMVSVNYFYYKLFK